MKSAPIDRAKLRAYARTLDVHALLVWLDRAFDLLPDDALPNVIAGYVRADALVGDPASRPDLLQSTRQFHRDSLSGRYYQDFNVNSRNFKEMSRGTETWIAEHTRLLDGCLQAERAADHETARQGFELLIGLLRELDRGEVEIVFFADEGGSWQLGVNWREVLPAWFRSLASDCDPYEYAELVVDAINDFAGHEAGAILAAAREIATSSQNAALSEYEGNLRRRT